MMNRNLVHIRKTIDNKIEHVIYESLIYFKGFLLNIQAVF